MLDFTSDVADDAVSSRTTASAPVDDRALLDAYSNAVIDVTDRVGPAVVRVETGPKVPDRRERGGLGSGIVISPDGLVLTNSHVVGSSREIRLRDVEGNVGDAQVLGVDPDTDLALLRANGVRHLPYAALGNSKSLKRGQLVIAIGNLGDELLVATHLSRDRPGDEHHHRDNRQSDQHLEEREAPFACRCQNAVVVHPLTLQVETCVAPDVKIETLP